MGEAHLRALLRNLKTKKNHKDLDKHQQLKRISMVMSMVQSAKLHWHGPWVYPSGTWSSACSDTRAITSSCGCRTVGRHPTEYWNTAVKMEHPVTKIQVLDF